MGVGEEGPVLHVRWAAEDPNPRAGELWLGSPKQWL